MTTLARRMARVGAVGFVVAWAVFTLVMTAAALGSGPRPTLQARDASADAAPGSPADSAGPSTTLGPAKAPTSTLAGSTVAPTPPVPAHLGSPVRSGGAVETEVLPSVAVAPDPVQAQPDLTG